LMLCLRARVFVARALHLFAFSPARVLPPTRSTLTPHACVHLRVVNNIAEALLMHLDELRTSPELECTGWVRALQDHPSASRPVPEIDAEEPGEEILSGLHFKKDDLIFLYLVGGARRD
jgi:hypothetical protein